MVKRWGEKRYYSLDHYLKNTYGEKLYKISRTEWHDLARTVTARWDAGAAYRCSAGGSGDFASDRKLSITENRSSRGKGRLPPNIQALPILPTSRHTPTLSSTKLPIYAMCRRRPSGIPEVKILSHCHMGWTRSGEDVLKLLDELNQIKPVWIELGLQTIHPDTARFIRRGYDLPVFEQAVSRLRLLNIDVIVHTILCLPGEDMEKMLSRNGAVPGTATGHPGHEVPAAAHILKNTDLAGYYEKHPFYLPSMEEYFGILGQCLCALSPDIVIHRLTGDGPKPLLIAPLWTGNKRQVLNQMQAYFKKQDIWQGKEL
ncbi:MAG: radical SAM protein [[Clostridium] scindens]